MKLQQKIMILLGMGMLLSFLSGCTSAQSSSGPILNVKVIADKTATPLSIHFFTLKSDDVFKRLDYFELVSTRNINWNGELINRAKTLLIPGKTEIFQTQLNSDIQYYALVIGFKDVQDNDNWRYLQSVIPNQNNNIALKLSQKNSYTSKAVKRVPSSETSRVNTRVTNMTNKVSEQVNNRVNSEKNKIIDNTLNKVFGSIF